MTRLNIKPLSLNSAYRGRRFTTPALDDYKESIDRLAPRLKIPEGKLKATYIFGVSSRNSDVDNLIKCLQDSLSVKYGFNDKHIYKLVVEKVDVPRGQEYVEFEIVGI